MPERTELLTNRPIPGQSLTQNPKEPKPYEKAPKYTRIEEATGLLFTLCFSNEITEQILQGEHVSVDNEVQNILQEGFENGYWSPDLAMILVEPATYCVIMVASQANMPITFATDGTHADHTGILEMTGNGLKSEIEIFREMRRATLQQDITTQETPQESPTRSLINGGQ